MKPSNYLSIYSHNPVSMLCNRQPLAILMAFDSTQFTVDSTLTIGALLLFVYCFKRNVFNKQYNSSMNPRYFTVAFTALPLVLI